MREPLKDKERLEHILSAIDTILQRTEGMTLENLIVDKILFGGIVYYTLIVGEAAYNLTKQFRRVYNQVDWEQIAKMRHNLVHGYYQVDPDIIWSVIQSDLPKLRNEVLHYLSSIDWNEWESQVFVIKETSVHKSLIQTALRMKARNYDFDEICKITGLSREEIEKL